MAESPKKSPTPPYVPYKTLRNFIDKYKQGVPSRIDRDLMGSMSGASQSQVVVSLKFLGFISDNNLTLEPMRAFAVAEGEARKELLKTILEKSYPYLFDGKFDLKSATASQLREAIEANTGATGETVNRCIAFFKDASNDAGIAISPFITQKKPRSAAPKKRNGASKVTADLARMAERKNPAIQNLHFREHPTPPPIEAQNSMLLWGLFQRLPKPGSVWPKEQRDQWTETLNNVLALEYKEQ
jgi:hypothetical protein